MFRMNKGTPEKIGKVLDFLRDNGSVHLRGIAKNVGLGIGVTAWIVDSYLEDFVNINSISEYGFKAKIVSLKPDKVNATVEDVLRYKMLRKRLKSVGHETKES